ncbi:Uncharacterised protein [Mycobacteroides abscessus subsp. abscessus]|nr:Uncharacterised protein [Mycobacteroides abscessus subsp. abscessus]
MVVSKISGSAQNRTVVPVRSVGSPLTSLDGVASL